MSNQALKTLCQQYVRGEISKPEYRQRRKQIIDEATGIVEVDTGTEYPAVDQKVAHSIPLKKAGIISAIIVVMILILYSAI